MWIDDFQYLINFSLSLADKQKDKRPVKYDFLGRGSETCAQTYSVVKKVTPKLFAIFSLVVNFIQSGMGNQLKA